jgi:hypothetical protein
MLDSKNLNAVTCVTAWQGMCRTFRKVLHTLALAFFGAIELSKIKHLSNVKTPETTSHSLSHPASLFIRMPWESSSRANDIRHQHMDYYREPIVPWSRVLQKKMGNTSPDAPQTTSRAWVTERTSLQYPARTGVECACTIALSL